MIDLTISDMVNEARSSRFDAKIGKCDDRDEEDTWKRARSHLASFDL